MASGLDILKSTLGLHDEGGNKLSGKSSKYTLFNETQNKIITESNDVTYRVEVYEKLLKSFVGKFYNKKPKTTTGTSKKKSNKTRNGDDETLDFIIQYITLYFETYKSITSDVDSYNVANDLEVLDKLKKMKMNSSTRIYEIIHRLSDVDAEKKIRSKTSEIFSKVEKLVASYITFKKNNHKNIAQSIVEETKSVIKTAWQKKGTLGKGLLAAGAGAAMTEAGSFLGHFFKHEKIGTIARVPGELFLARAAAKAENFRDKQHRLKESLEKLDRDSKKSRIYKDIKSKFGGGGSYKALRSSTVMVGDNPGGRESVNVGNQAFKTRGPSLIKVKAGQSIHANPLSGMGKTRINPGDFDALGGGTEAPLTATANTDRITDALDKNTEILELIYKEQHNKYKEDRKIGRKKTLGEHVGGFIDSPDKKGYIKNLVNKSSLGETSLGDKTIGEHVGGFLDAADKKGYIKNVIKDKTINKLFGKGKGIAEGIGEAGNLAKGAEAAGGLAEAAGGAEAVAGGAGLLATAAPVVLTAAAAGLLGWGGYKMATGHNAGVAPESMLPSMGGAGRSVTVGDTVRTGTHAWRDNNQGNIRYGDFAKSHGAIGEDKGFAVFPDAKAGEAAQQKLLFGTKGYKDKTLTEAIAKYAPASENNVPAYQQAVLSKVGANKKMSEYTPAEQKIITDAMKVHEGYKEGKITALSPTANNPVPVTPKKLAEKQLEVVKAQADIHAKEKTDAQAKKDALAKVASKTAVNVGDTTRNVDRETSTKGTTVLSSGDSSLITMFNAQWGRS